MTGWRGQLFTSYNATTERETMPIVTLWCNIDDPETNYIHQIGHPFSGADPDRKHYAATAVVQVQTGNSYGTPTYQTREEVTEEIEMCGYHWRKSNPFASKREEIPPPKPTDAHATLDELEAEDDDYRRGYEAAERHFYSKLGD